MVNDPLFRMVTGRGSPCPSTVGPKCFRWLQTRNAFSSPPRTVGAGDKVCVLQDELTILWIVILSINARNSRIYFIFMHSEIYLMKSQIGDCYHPIVLFQADLGRNQTMTSMPETHSRHGSGGDGLTVSSGVNRSDFTFRSGVFQGFPRVTRRFGCPMLRSLEWNEAGGWFQRSFFFRP